MTKEEGARYSLAKTAISYLILSCSSSSSSGRGNQTLNFLVVGVLKVDGLPGFDRLISSLKNGLYAFAKVRVLLLYGCVLHSIYSIYSIQGRVRRL